MGTSGERATLVSWAGRCRTSTDTVGLQSGLRRVFIDVDVSLEGARVWCRSRNRTSRPMAVPSAALRFTNALVGLDGKPAFRPLLRGVAMG